MARHLDGVLRAFVDRSAIDWAELRTRARTPCDRQILEALSVLEQLRVPHTLEAQSGSDTSSRVMLRLLLGCCLVQLASLLTLVVTAAAHGTEPQARSPQMALAIAFASAGLLLSEGTRRDLSTLALGTWCTTAATAFARSVARALPPEWWAPIQPLVQGITLEAFAPACLWLFARGFPVSQRFAVFDLWARRASIVGWGVGGLLLVINIAGSEGYPGGGSLAYLLSEHSSGLFWKVLAVGLVPATLAIWLRTRRAPVAERQRSVRLSGAIATGTAPFLLSIIGKTAWPRFDAWLSESPFGAGAWLDATVMAGLTATPLLVAAAVIIDRPFALRTHLQRALRFALARHAISALLLTPFVLIGFRLYQLREVTLADVARSTDAWVMLGSLTAFVLLVLARPRLLRALDQRESRRLAEHQQQLAAGLERIRLARGTREIGAVLEAELRDGTGTAFVRVLTADAAGGYADIAGRLPTLPPHSALTVMLRHARILDVSPAASLFSLLPRDDRQWVDAHDVALIAPIVHRDDTLAGLVALGGKRGGIGFDARDAWLVATMSAAAAAAWAAHGPGIAESSRPQAAPLDPEAAWECSLCGIVSDALPLSCACGQPARLAALPTRIGTDILVVRRIGAGGMGVVYLGHDTALARDVALKTLPSLSPGAVQRMVEEARTMAAFSHACLATIHGLRTWQQTPVLIVEYLPHGTLAARLTRGPLPLADVLSLGEQIAAVLAVMHGADRLHRDLKPSNIGLTGDGTPKLLDFGLASLTTQGHGPETITGTPAYLPPEAFSGSPPDVSWDLWALAVVMLEAATGHNPFLGSARDRLHSHVAALPPALRALLLRGLARPVNRRFATAAELRAAIADVTLDAPA